MPDPAIAVWAEYGRRENVLKKGGCQVTDYLAFIMKKLFIKERLYSKGEKMKK